MRAGSGDDGCAGGELLEIQQGVSTEHQNNSSEVDTDKPRRQIETPPDNLKTLISIATNVWRAKTKILHPAGSEVRDDMRRVDRHIEAIYRNLAEVGIAIRDHTGDVYDEGQPMRVVASKPTPGLDKKHVSETLLPSIFWNNRLVQNGEIEIATADSPNPAH